MYKYVNFEKDLNCSLGIEKNIHLKSKFIIK